MTKRFSLFIFVTFLNLFPALWIGKTDFYTRGEPREALIAQSMLKTNNYILPRGYGDSLPSKPPALHWAITLISKFSGYIDEMTSRMPSVIFSYLFLIFFTLFIFDRYDFQLALLTATVLGVSLEWARAASSCRVDMLHASSMAAGLILYYNFVKDGQKKNLIFSIVAFIISTLSKGPVSIVLPAGIIFIFLILEKTSIKNIFIKLTTLIVPVLAFSSIWYLLAYSIGGEEFIQKVNYENVQRFMGTMEDAPHKHSVFYLFGVLILGILPWILYTIPQLSKLRLAKLKLINHTALISSWRNAEAFTKYSIICSAIIFVFYALPSSKRGVYLLSLYPFLSFLLSKFFLSNLSGLEKIHKIISSVLTLIITALFIFVLFLEFNSFNKFLNFNLFNNLQHIITLSLSNLCLLILPIIIYLFCQAEKYKRNIVAKIAVFYFGILVCFHGVLHPAISKLASPKLLAASLKGLILSDEKIYSFENEFYGLSFYLDRQFYNFDPAKLTNGIFVLRKVNWENFKSILPANFFAELLVEDKLNPLDKRDDVVVLRVRN